MVSTRIDSARSVAGRWLATAATVVLLAAPAGVSAQDIRIVADSSGSRLQVDGRDFMIRGMNWDYFPIGTNYAYSLWSQPDDVILAALDREMPLLKAMGVNTIRQYVGVPPRWVRHIYERYGIFTVLNHSMGRYGFNLDGTWHANVDYSDPRMRAAITADVVAAVEEFRGVPGVLMWLLGNENNYGLVWESAETSALPLGEREAAKARHLYSLFGEVVNAIKERDQAHPVSMANGDLQYIDLIAEEVHGLDVFGANVYRGTSFGDVFRVVQEKLGLPVMFTEFGADAWNAREMREDQLTQARYLRSQWQEIYEQTSGKGGVGNAIGGFTFQFSDGWWKTGQENNLDVHDITAAWANAGYREDFRQGDNNMNEEWWGITAKGPTDSRGLYELYPRAAYYVLQKAYTLDPYAPSTDLAAIQTHFAAIEPTAAVLQARGDGAAQATDALSRLRISSMRAEFETYSTGGTSISTPASDKPPQSRLPSFLGFDHLQSFYAAVEARPAGNVTASVEVNVLGNVPENPIDQIFYENRGRRRTVVVDSETVALESLERVKVYRAGVAWDDRYFKLDGFYRTGHYHWGYEGDFFGLYREANYGPNIDIYNAGAPLGFEMAGKREFDGLKIAFGPELWWGANPAFLGKYRRSLGAFDVTGIYQEEFTRRTGAVSSFAIPLPPTRKATLQVATKRGPFGLEVGGIWSGSTKEGEAFQVARGSSGNYSVFEDSIKSSDAFGGKAKVTVSSGRWNWYAQGAGMGLVADGGPTSALTFTGWGLKDTGSGNQWNFMSGIAVLMGKFQIAPNFLWQKPVEGPVPSGVPAPGRPRNVLDDPFAVRANRETVGGELLVTYDPTPATWMYAWDNFAREDAKLAVSAGVTVRHLPTTLDAAIGILPDGRTTFAFPGATPPRDLWEARARVMAQLRPNTRLMVNLLAGTGEPNGDDTRLIHRYGADAKLAIGSVNFETFAKFNDWGPYDYHRDFNLTFPAQLMGDLSIGIGRPSWFDDAAQTRLGVRGSWRSLDRYSPRYCPLRVVDPLGSGALVCDPVAPGPNGSEWEIRTYLHVGM